MSADWINLSDDEVSTSGAIISGTGVLTHAQLGAFFGQVFKGAYGTANYGVPADPKPLTERELWNAAVDQRKADKQAAKGKA